MKINIVLKYRFYIGLIIFSFAWVIIGDLVSMHMRVISHIDLQEHSPFANIHKSVKSQGIQKNAKYFDEGFSFNADFILSDKIIINPYLNYFEIVSSTVSILYKEQSTRLFSGRAPPKFV